jgi:molybdopterin converting factor small subunit
MILLKIPTPLRAYTQGQNEIPVKGSTVADAMQDLVAQYPSLQTHLFNGKGELRPFVNLFLNDENIRDLQGVQTPIGDGDLLKLIPSIAGG